MALKTTGDPAITRDTGASESEPVKEEQGQPLLRTENRDGGMFDRSGVENLPGRLPTGEILARNDTSRLPTTSGNMRGGTTMRAAGANLRPAPQVWRGPTEWWPQTDGEMDVDIDGYDFDFEEPDTDAGRGRVAGRANGPLSHDGRYQVLENGGTKFRMRVTVGTNKPQRNNDLNVEIKVERRTVNGQHRDVATVTGSVGGKQLPEGGVEGTLSRDGDGRWQLGFVEENGTEHTVSWAQD